MTVRELNDKLQTLDVDELVLQAIQLNEKAMVQINREQMEVGKNAEGQSIGYYRSLSYANFKKNIGSRSPFRIPDLKLTGDFHKGMAMDVEDNKYFIYSTDDKAPDLTDRYGPIWGIAPENQDRAKEINTRTLGRLFKEATGIKG